MGFVQLKVIHAVMEQHRASALSRPIHGETNLDLTRKECVPTALELALWNAGDLNGRVDATLQKRQGAVIFSHWQDAHEASRENVPATASGATRRRSSSLSRSTARQSIAGFD